MKNLWKALTSRMFLTILIIVIQMLFLIGIIFFIGNLYYYNIVFYTLSALMALWIINRNDNPAYKIAWIVLIMLLPLAGGVLYLLFGKNRTTKKMQISIKNIVKVNEYFLPSNEEYIREIEKLNSQYAKHVKYIHSTTRQPVWKNTQTSFLSPGEKKFEAMLNDLKKAEKFIFLEYFIITPGHMWGNILKILAEKAKQGVQIKLIYDDMGTINTLPANYDAILAQLGIEAYVFNPFKPRLNTFMNNRDHRKILIIDGNIGYTGGINLADEYINKRQRFGYWKDSAIRIEGEGVQSLTLMFLQMWYYVSNTLLDCKRYFPTKSVPSDGYVMPFADNPVDNNQAAEKVYLNIINSATQYVYIQTPYLVMDNELTTALCLAAKNGLDVRIVTPHIPDKFYVHTLTRASYKELIQAGVKIYEFTPGFIHSKVILADDQVGVIGTANFDFRSLYLHFECAVWLYRSKALTEAYQDFLDILGVSQRITIQDCINVPCYQRLLRAVLKVFAPLM